jgi:hypothetical protein
MRKQVERFGFVRVLCLGALFAVVSLGPGIPRVSADNSELYLINACSTPKSDAKFPAALQHLNKAGTGLEPVRTLVEADAGTSFVLCNPQARVVVLGSPHYVPEQISVVHMDAPRTPLSFSVEFPPRLSFIEAHLFDVPGHAPRLGVFVSGLGATANRILGADLATKEQRQLSWDVYKHTLVAGYPGGVGTSSDFLEVFPYSDGSLTVRKGGETIQMPWRLLRSVSFPPDDLVFVYVNNADYLALRSNRSKVEGPNVLGSLEFQFLDKGSQQWHSATFPGSWTVGVRGFGPWFAGLVQGRIRKKDSPGLEQRRQAITSTGVPLDWELRDGHLYRPGVLFLYHVRTRKQYTIRTDQGDSEILLVDGGSVYYRVNRSIYKAKIGERDVEPGELLVEADVVQDIHWAFLGPALPASTR